MSVKSDNSSRNASSGLEHLVKNLMDWYLFLIYQPLPVPVFSIQNAFPSEIFRNGEKIQLTGKKLNDIFPGIENQWLLDQIAANNTEKPLLFDYHNKEFNLDFNGKLNRDPSGDTKYFLHLSGKGSYTDFQNGSEKISLFNSILSDVPSIIYFKDTNYRYHSFNEAFLKLIGKTGQEVFQKTDYDIFPTKTADKFRISDEKILITGDPILNQEERILLDDCRMIWVLSNKKPVFDAQGKITGILGICNEITRSKIAEEALIKERTFFETLLANSTDHIYFKDLKSRFLRISAAQLKRFGLQSEEEIIGKTDFDIFSEEHARQAFEDEARIIKTGIPMIGYEEKETWPDGSITWVSTSKIPIRSEKGDVIGIFGISRDITEEKFAKEALKFTQFAVDNSAEAAFWIMSDGFFVYTNLEATNMLDYSREEFLSMSIFDIDPAIIPKKWNQFWKFLKRKKKIIFETTYRSKTGKIVQVEIISNFVVFEGREYNCSFARDISDRKKAEEALLENEKRLIEQNEAYQAINEELIESNKRIQIINNELLKAKQKAEESDRLKSAFLANMSHEIRTPMNAIIGFSDMLKRATHSPEKIEKYTSIINTNSHQLLAIINDIIDISKIESGQIMLYNNDTNINQVLNELYSIFELMARNKNLTMSLCKDLEDEESTINIDETKLRQIFTNLIGNALKFTSEGQIEMGYRKTNPYIEFYVSDTGIGIAPEHFEIIFERFRQVDLTSTRKFGGTGLGLSISKALVELMGGKIWLDSEPGKGSTFYFTIPAVFPQQNNQSQSEYDLKAEIHKWNNKTILIAEDEEYNYFYLHEILKPTGVNILQAFNGRDAIERCKNNPSIDLVLMDIKMPVLDGYSATKEIKALRPGLPVIAQTAFGLADDKKKAMDMGFDGYISKPILKEKLFMIIDKFLNY